MEEIEDMEELAMAGNKMEKKAMLEKKKKREHIRKLKRLVGLDSWENPDELIVSEAGEKLINYVKFIKDPMVKKEFTKAQFKTVNNCLVDIINVFSELEVAYEDNLLKKV